MILTAALAHQFSETSRTRGDEYAAGGRVRLLSGSGVEVEAIVHGRMPYHVVVARADNPDGYVGFGASCECPVATGQGAACKHLWATLRVAETRGHLDTGVPLDAEEAYLDIVPPDQGLVDDLGVPRLIGPSSPARRGGFASPRRPDEAAPPTPSRVLIDAMDDFLDEREQLGLDGPTFRYAHSELMYVIDVSAVRESRGLAVLIFARKRKRSGEWGKPKPATMAAAEIAAAPAIDREVLAPLFGASRGYGSYGLPDLAYDPYGGVPSSAFALSESLIGQVLPRLAATRRLFLRDNPQSETFTPLTWDPDPVWDLQVDVRREPDGFRLEAVFTRDGERMDPASVVLALAAGFVVTRQRVSRVRTGDGFVFATKLAQAGGLVVDASDGPDLARLLARASVPGRNLPEELRVEEIDVRPAPRLDVEADPQGADRLVGSVSFDYNGSRVEMAPAVARTFDPERRRTIRRRPDDEAAAVEALGQAGFRPLLTPTTGAPAFGMPSRQFPGAVRALLAQGWRVEAKGRLYRSAGPVQLSVSSGIDWFDLEGRVEFGDTAVPLTDVLAALRRGDDTVSLGDGALGLMPEDWLRRYGPLAATGEVVDGHLRFGRVQAALLDALLAERDDNITVSVDAVFARVRDEIARGSTIGPLEPPASFQGALRGYQKDGLGWFQFLRRLNFGGCLADDMGLGKTVMVLALLAWWQEARAGEPDARRPSVVVVPRTLVHNWKSEAARFAPSLRVLDYSGAGRRAVDQDLGDADIVLVTYGTLRRDVQRLKDVEFEYVVIDEAQAIKNATTVSAKAVRLLRGRYRLALTGTPVENHLGELWSLFEFLNPGLLGASSLFERATSATSPDADAVALLSRGLRPFLLRRTKAQVARDLPEKTEQTIVCELSPRERAFYNGLRQHYRTALLDRVERLGVGRSQVQILEALLRLRQAACHPGLVEPARRAESSAKLDVLIPQLLEVAEEGHKALVFSQFTSFLSLVRNRLDEAGVTYEYLDGKTRDRAACVQRFQEDPACPLFLISLKAGGVGLNLTAAEYVFLLDPWWNPAVEAQAIDRTHRIGQTREVFAYRLIAGDTVEEKVLDLQQRKRALADAVLSADAPGLRGLSREDLELLLS